MCVFGALVVVLLSSTPRAHKGTSAERVHIRACNRNINSIPGGIDEARAIIRTHSGSMLKPKLQQRPSCLTGLTASHNRSASSIVP